ncbi:MAG: alpha/beta hydrolase [Paracoccaceae bacterium]
MADRPAHDPRAGHVRDFSEYQADLQAVLDVLPELDLPKPFYLVAHSMGGCIGLRALHNALPVRAAAFSAPMWDIGVKPPMRLLGWGLSHLSRVFGYSHHYAPKTGPVTYVAEAPFADNMLTTDAAMYALMQDQARARPELTLGGPTFAWLAAAFDEIAALRRMPSPPVPAYCALGGRERIVSPEAIHDRMARWPGGTLDVIADAEHEVIMETAAIRARFFDAATALFAANP